MVGRIDIEFDRTYRTHFMPYEIAEGHISKSIRIVSGKITTGKQFWEKEIMATVGNFLTFLFRIATSIVTDLFN